MISFSVSLYVRFETLSFIMLSMDVSCIGSKVMYVLQVYDVGVLFVRRLKVIKFEVSFKLLLL